MPTNGHRPGANPAAAVGARVAPAQSPPTHPSNSEPPDESPLEYMLRVMRDGDADRDRRDAMAKAAAPYVHARAVTKKKREGILTPEEAADARRTLAEKVAQLSAAAVAAGEFPAPAGDRD